MKRRNWFDELTPDEQSMIATCIANSVPLCCVEGRKNVLVITKDRRKRRGLSDWAYAELSCQYHDRPGDIERFLFKFFNLCGYEAHDMHDEILTWEDQQMKAARMGKWR